MSRIKRFFTLALLLFATYCAEAQLVSINIGTRRRIPPPPPPRACARPVCPGPDYIWHDGRWAWDDYIGDYVWVAGYWEYLPPRTYNRHVPRGRAHGYWKKRGRY